MKKIIIDITAGFLIAAGFILLTVFLIRSASADKYLPLYCGLILLAFMFFSIYGAVIVALSSTFVAIAVLIITPHIIAIPYMAFYWVVIVFLYYYLKDIDEDYGEYKLEIENSRQKISELSIEEKKLRDLIPVLEERIKRYILMSDFSLKLNTSFEVGNLYSFILEYVRKIFPSKRVNIIKLPKDQYDRWVKKKSMPLLVENTSKDYRFKSMHDFSDKIISLMSCPLFHKDEVTGTIRVESSAGTFLSSDLRLLNVTSTLSSIAIERSGLFIRTQQLAITDSLTSLYTHSYFKERLEEEIVRAARYDEKFVVFMMDIDKFKVVNDTYGHPAGDMVLKDIASIIKETVRETDIVGRYGGEEISVILYNIQSRALDIAERIRASIESLKFKFEGKEFSVTITIGASFFPACPTSEEIIRRADEALYSGKKEGRNRVLFFGK